MNSKGWWESVSRKPWIMTQEWHDVLFLHWPVDPEDVREHIPSELELDLYNNMAWISLVFFKVKGNRPRLVPPIPGMSAYLELNVRTYVTYKGRAGVHFFNLDANHPLIVKMTRTGNFLPYRNAEISLNRSKKTFTIHSRCTHENAFPESLVTSFEPLPGLIYRGYFERWLTDRYYMWTKLENHLLRVDIIHKPWELQNVRGLIYKNTMASFIKGNFKVRRPIAHYSKMKKAWFFPPVIEI